MATPTLFENAYSIINVVSDKPVDALLAFARERDLSFLRDELTRIREDAGKPMEEKVKAHFHCNTNGEAITFEVERTNDDDYSIIVNDYKKLKKLVFINSNPTKTYIGPNISDLDAKNLDKKNLNKKYQFDLE